MRAGPACRDAQHLPAPAECKRLLRELYLPRVRGSVRFSGPAGPTIIGWGRGWRSLVPAVTGVIISLSVPPAAAVLLRTLYFSTAYGCTVLLKMTVATGCRPVDCC